MTKVNSRSVLKYVSLAFVFCVFSCASVNGISPFLFAFYFSCLFVGLDEKILTAFLVASACLTSWTLESFLISLTVGAVGLIMYYIHKFSKKKYRLITIFVCYLLSLVTYIYYHCAEWKNLLWYLFLGLVSLYAFILVLQTLFLKKNCFQLTLDESICFLFAIAILGLGVQPVDIFSFELYRAILALIMFVLVSVGCSSLTFSVVLAFSLGVSLAGATVAPIAEFMILTIVASMFSMPNRFKMVFLTIAVEVFVQFYFFSQNWEMFFAVLPILLVAMVFVCLPKKWLTGLADIVYVKKSEISSRNLINTTRKSIKRRMAELSNVFLDMKQIHLNMIKQNLSKPELVAMLKRELNNTICKDCLEKNRCNRSLGTDNLSSIESLINIVVEKGKITLLDIPPALTNRCAKLNQVVAQINRLGDEYRQFKNMQEDVNNVKYLLADQMGAVSKLLISLGNEIETNVNFDVAKENKIISRLLSLNVQCKEVLLYTEKQDDISAIFVVKSDNILNPILERVASETLKVPMQITRVGLSENGYSPVFLRRISKFDCIFGLASCNKAGNEECGDCHSIIRLGGDKFLLALCDGMGAGKHAHKMSAMTLGLIENFYKAGFDNDIILDSVNKLLAVNNQEDYSTLDACLIDLNNQTADFIKVGSPFGLVKKEGETIVIESGSLPIGALDKIKPATCHITISTKDIIIIATDGVVDAFEQEEDMIEFVSKLASNNPQSIAETLLNEALNRYEMTARDDMTVLVARTYLKNS